ncbi:terminase small subunit [Oscillospiraceae bacterium 42-9]
MGRPHKYRTPAALSAAWQLYKDYCNNQIVSMQKFNKLNGEFTSGEISRCITYTIKGFCAWAGLSRSTFYGNYANNARFADTVTRVREECEVDARTKFELGLIPAHLAPLWMGSYKWDYAQKESVVIR